MAENGPGTTITLDVQRDGLPAPETANWFNFARGNDSFQLSMGFVDLARANEVIQSGEAQSVPVMVTHRFHLTASGVEMLYQVVSQIRGARKPEGDTK